jgi:hypothetical protein
LVTRHFKQKGEDCNPELSSVNQDCRILWLRIEWSIHRSRVQSSGLL